MISDGIDEMFETYIERISQIEKYQSNSMV